METLLIMISQDGQFAGQFSGEDDHGTTLQLEGPWPEWNSCPTIGEEALGSPRNRVPCGVTRVPPTSSCRH